MDVQLIVAFDTEELGQLKESGLIGDFVRKQEGNWNHSQWEDFLTSVRGLGYSLPSHVLGAELEYEKEFYWKAKRGEITVPESAGISRDASSECAVVCESADRLAAIAPALGKDPESPKMPKRELFDPIVELENAVVHETGLGAAEKGVREETRMDEGEHPWDNVDFDTLSKEERAEYMKSQLRKKMGEG